jgi:hypothetical protein
LVAKKDIKDTDLIQVWNNSRGDCGYTINNGNFQVRRTWVLPASMQEVEMKELKSAMNEAGVRELFEVYNKELGKYEDGELLIKNDLAREKLDLQPLGKYTFVKEQIVDLLNNKSVKYLEEVLENCPNSTLDNIVQEAINISLSDIVKINLIKSYSGKDILPVIQSKNADTPPKVVVKKEEGTRSKKG